MIGKLVGYGLLNPALAGDIGYMLGVCLLNILIKVSLLLFFSFFFFTSGGRGVTCMLSTIYKLLTMDRWSRRRKMEGTVIEDGGLIIRGKSQFGVVQAETK